jgi:catechol 2,3-dioxygenase-like lactoylglutathione lyase family enzyme
VTSPEGMTEGARNSATGPGIPGLRAVDHIGLTVPDLDEAVAFFVDHLGARLVYRDGPFGGPELEMEQRLDVHPEAVSLLAMLRLGDRLNLELFEYQAPDQRREGPRNSDIGGHHLALYVDDVDSARDYLEAVPGVRLMAGPNNVPEGAPIEGQRWFYFTAPWGLQMEVTSCAGPGFYDGLPGADLVPPPSRQ